jgi:hypothetical protein
LETAKAVFGQADAQLSGIFDLIKSDNEITIVYHFYTSEPKDIDDDIGIEMGPKIKAFYQKYKTLDRVLFNVEVIRSGLDSDWKPYCAFRMTRKIIEETNWTEILDKDLFKAAENLTYVE